MGKAGAARPPMHGRPSRDILRRQQAVHPWRLEAFSWAVTVGSLLRLSSHLSRGSLDSTSQSEAGCLSLLRTHPRYLILNRISPELTGAPGSTCDWRGKCPDGVKGSLVGSTGVPESLGGRSFKTSYCAPLGFGLVNQNLGRSPCRLDMSMTCRLVDCRHPRGLRTSALGGTFHASNAIPPPLADEPQFIEIDPCRGSPSLSLVIRVALCQPLDNSPHSLDPWTHPAFFSERISRHICCRWRLCR